MKPRVNDQNCGASENACKVIKICPVEAISYIETDATITDRTVNCNALPNNEAKCGCDCGCGGNTNDCGGSPYGRIIIDYDKCTGCGLCAEECCGAAIEMVEVN